MQSRTPDLTPKRCARLSGALEEHGLVGFDSPERRAEAMGIVVVPDDLPSKLPGWAHPVGGLWHIVVSRELSQSEREWTVAHELTHIVCDDQGEDQADAGAAEMLFLRRERELQAALRAVRETGDLGGALGGVATAFSSLMELEPHLIDDRKKRYVDSLAIALALVGIASLVGFGLVKLFEFFERRRATTLDVTA